MRKNRGIAFFMSAVLAGMLLGNSFVSAAQEAAAPARQNQTALTGVVDMLSLMRAHPKLNDDLKQFNAYRMQKANELMTREKALQEESKVLMQMFSGASKTDAAYTAKNDELLKKASELDIEKNKAQRELVIMDIRMKYEAFKSIRDEIQNYAGRRGFITIMDFRTIDPEADELSNAEVEVTQPIIWHHPQVNLTSFIVEALNARFKEYAPAAQVDPKTRKITFLNSPNLNSPDALGVSNPTPPIPVKPTPGMQPQRPAAAANPQGAPATRRQ